MSVTGRLAPTPSGHLHLGNATAFLAAWLSVRSQGGRLLLRNEDVDVGRARDAVAAGQRRDLEWLGLTWDEETPAQSTRDYAPWLERLHGHTYFCTCRRSGLVGPYPGTCRDAGHTSGKIRFRVPDGSVLYTDRKWGPRRADPTDDPVLVRADGVFAYNLAVVADDIADGVSEVVRGADLLDHTAVQIRIWEAFGATPPTWLHAPLILGPDGKKLSKSHGAMHIGALRTAGWTAADVLRVILPWLGLEGDSLDAVRSFDPTKGPLGPIQVLDDTIPTPDAGFLSSRGSDRPATDL